MKSIRRISLATVIGLGLCSTAYDQNKTVPGPMEPYYWTYGYYLDTVDAPLVTYNQRSITFRRAMPGKIDGQLIIPLREFASQIGATVAWRDDTKQVEVSLPNRNTFALTAMAPSAFVEEEGGRAQPFAGGLNTQLTVGSDEFLLIANRAYIPFSHLASLLNAKCHWDHGLGTATITTK